MVMKKSKDVLLVIDMQNVYLPGQEWACPAMEKAAAVIQKLLENCTFENIFFTKYTAAEDPVGAWKQYNEVNEKINHDIWLNEIIDELKPYLEKGRVVEKSVYSSMKIPEIVEAVKNAEHVVLTGVVAECCVLATMLEAIDLGCSVIYLTDGIAGQSKEKEEQMKTLAESFAPVHVCIQTYEEYCKMTTGNKTTQNKIRENKTTENKETENKETKNEATENKMVEM